MDIYYSTSGCWGSLTYPNLPRYRGTGQPAKSRDGRSQGMRMRPWLLSRMVLVPREVVQAWHRYSCSSPSGRTSRSLL